jgi:serine/threonine protein kinase
MQVEQILQGRYQLKQQLGQNAGRQTWLATDVKVLPPSPVIVKLLAFNPQMQWDDLKLFEREAQVLKNINHPRIPQYRDYFSVDAVENSELPCFGLVQEYIPGDSLDQLLDQGKRFTEEEVHSIGTQVLKILICLHELSPPVLHRDIKPSNLILRQDNQIYLVDFGAVQDRAKSEGLTFTVVGTSGYASPEQLWGKAVAASDLYALGATLIHLLTGTSPAELPQQRMRIQFKERVSINPDFANWIEQLIQPAQEKRFSTARKALSALQTTHPISDNTKNSSRLVSHSPNYFVGGSLVALLGFFWLLPPLFPLGFQRKGLVHPPQKKGAMNVAAMNRAQQAYFLEENAFRDDMEKLGIGLTTQTKPYSYSIRATDKAAFQYGVAHPDAYTYGAKSFGPFYWEVREPERSYVGGVFAVERQFGPKADEKEMLLVTIICEALHPGPTKPPEPTLQNGVPTCSEGTRDLSKWFRRRTSGQY